MFMFNDCIINFPLIFKLGLNSACKSLLITTHEYLLQYAVEYKTENKSQHHITILTLLFWVWKPLEKPKMGKSVKQSHIDFIMRKCGTFTIIANSPKPGECSTQKNRWANPS